MPGGWQDCRRETIWFQLYRSTELDALRQRKFRAVVDRCGLPSHVNLPRVAAALATAAGFLLAAERAADLRAARADVHVGDAAIAAARRDEQLRFVHVVGEDGGTQALRDFVVVSDGVLELAIADDVEDRREGF